MPIFKSLKRIKYIYLLFFFIILLFIIYYFLFFILFKGNGECLTLALKNRCHNLINAVSRRRNFAKKCEINFLPLVYYDGQEPPYQNRLQCTEDVDGKLNYSFFHYSFSFDYRFWSMSSVSSAKRDIINQLRCDINKFISLLSQI